MARVKRNMIISGVSGSLGEDYYARITRDGRTIISTKPDFSNRQFSKEQLEQQSRMKQAAAYAKVASKTNPIYAQKALGKSKNAYNIALGDWFNPPVVNYIDWDQELIRVKASDDVMVTKVTITILNEAGTCLEQGNAELHQGVWWEYQAAHNGKIRV
ncbi:MAG TPA: hypothetical protein VK909_16480, partial [Anaerolineales bacterium]|nr:hypothetical protein [Anaerolineales bacterium]